MKVRLEIPIFLFTIGIVSSLIQLTGISNSSTIIFYFIVGLVFYAIKKTGITDKKVHIIFAFLIICLGVFADYLSYII